MKLSNMLKSSKVFPEQRTGSKQKQSTKEQRDFRRKQRKHRNNFKWEEDSYLSDEQPGLSFCTTSKWKNGNRD